MWKKNILLATRFQKHTNGFSELYKERLQDFQPHKI